MKLSIRDVTAVRLAYQSGMKKSDIARSFKVHPDTITRALKRVKAELEVFSEVDNAFVLPRNSTLVTNGELIASQLVITGKDEDGVIYCNDVYLTDHEGDTGEDEIPFPKQDLADWGFQENTLGVIAPIKVGKVYRFIDCNEIPADLPIRTHSIPPIEDETYFKLFQSPLVALDTVKPIALAMPPKEPPVLAEAKPIWNASNRFVSITIGRQVYNATNTHPKFSEIITACMAENFAKAVELIDVEIAVKRFTQGNIEIRDGELYYKGILIRSGLTKRIIERMDNGKDFKFFLPFLENLMTNPSNNAVQRLYDFLEANDIAITKDGYFIAWKKVSADFTDIRTGSFDNRVGALVQEDRFLVDERTDVTCSRGLHVCSKSYLPHYATEPYNRVVKVKVNPRDVVAIPKDYNNAKLRCCEYLVVEAV